MKKKKIKIYAFKTLDTYSCEIHKILRDSLVVRQYMNADNLQYCSYCLVFFLVCGGGLTTITTHQNCTCSRFNNLPVVSCSKGGETSARFINICTVVFTHLGVLLKHFVHALWLPKCLFIIFHWNVNNV